MTDEFDQEARRRKNKRSTLEEFQLVYTILKEFFGSETPIATITRKQMIELRDLYTKAPAHSSIHYPNKSLREAVTLGQRDKRKTIAPATFNKRMTFVALIFRFAVKERYLVITPVPDFSQKPDTERGGLARICSRRDPENFQRPSIQEVRGCTERGYNSSSSSPTAQILGSSDRTVSGIRMKEILQLRVKDIGVKDNVDCMWIRDQSDDALKSDPTRRAVPIHPLLKQLGFIQYVENVKNSGESDVFCDSTKRSRDGNRGSSYSKHFNRYLTKIGVKSDADASRCFHSLRHTFRDGLENAGIPPNIARRLGGWTDSTSLESQYGGRILPRLAEHLGKLRFEGLEISDFMGDPKPSRQRASLPSVQTGG